MLAKFFYNGKNSREFGLRISDRVGYGLPKPDYDFTSVPGRSGDIVTHNNRFENYELIYSVWAPCPSRNFEDKMREIKSWLSEHKTYSKLSDTFTPDYYREAVFTEISEPKITATVVEFDVTFNCKPYLHRVDGDKWLNLSGTGKLINPEFYSSLPIIEATLPNNDAIGVFSINNSTITVSGCTHIIIDCETQNAYFEGQNLNSKVNTALVELCSGENNYQIEGFSEFSLKPRWRTL